MRIIYNYKFDVTKYMKREEMIPVVLEYLNAKKLDFQDVLFRIYCYKSSEEKRKNYIEKLCLKDEFWNWYSTEYKCEFAKNTYITEVSNVEKGGWNCRGLDVRYTLDEVVGRLQEQIINMPKTRCNYKIAFNNINWTTSNTFDFPIVDSETPELYPLSSNITIFEDYLYKRYIVFNFEMVGKVCTNYIDDFVNQVGCSYEKEILFVKDEKEKEQYREAHSKIEKMLGEIDTNISIKYLKEPPSNRIHIKKILQNVFCKEDFQCGALVNGLYEFYKVDQYNNREEIYFDYDKNKRSLCSTITYKGNGYKHSIMYSDMKAKVSDANIEQYALNMLENVRILEKKYIPIIVQEYALMPSWCEW